MYFISWFGIIFELINSVILEDVSLKSAIPTGFLLSSTPYNKIPPLVFAKAETHFSQLFEYTVSNFSLKSILVHSISSSPLNSLKYFLHLYYTIRILN